MAFFPPHLLHLSQTVLESARAKKIRLVTAESCTGGLIAACLTEIAGASDVFERGFITYSNDAKLTHLSVDRKTLEDFGAVSAETVLEMAEGALRSSLADIAVAVTGIAGPGGATEGKPVGLVYIGLAGNGKADTTVLEKRLDGDRTEIRLKTVEAALFALKERIEGI